MNIHAVSKGAILYLVLLFSSVSFLIFNQFAVTERTFTMFLLATIFLVGLYTGRVSGKYAGLNGFLIGLITGVSLIFFVSAYTDMNWELNFMILVVWISLSVCGSFIGGKATRNKLIFKKKNTKTEEEVETKVA